MSPKTLQSGAVMIEMALCTTLLVALMMAGSEFGRAILSFNMLEKSTRSAARHLSQYTPTSAGYATAKMEARNLAVYGTTGVGGTALMAGLSTSQVLICDATSTANDAGCAGEVLANVPVDGTTPPSNFTRVNLVKVKITGATFTSLYAAVLPSFTFDTVSATMVQGN